MPVAECVRRVSHREYLTWKEVFKDEYNNPDRTDYYLMQLACEARRATLVRGQKAPKIQDFKVKFYDKDKSEETSKEDQEALDEIARLRWFNLVGLDKDGNKR